MKKYKQTSHYKFITTIYILPSLIVVKTLNCYFSNPQTEKTSLTLTHKHEEQHSSSLSNRYEAVLLPCETDELNFCISYILFYSPESVLTYSS